ncbi:hypothetical protein Aglo03_01540 [Actinokineospora globicatena]|uniref:Uncharacterized protein n=1 Tax=Actinokineospora globicatena TaxID=103729 RepID=A0A9W6QJL5_9PSEU|nr:hypothetical protein Aglo03_01540 [Actinokineospora globicatena]
MLRVGQGVAAVGFAVGAVLSFLVCWPSALTTAGYRGETGTYQVTSCSTRSTPDGDVHRCTGVFQPEDSAQPAATLALDPARDPHPVGTVLPVHRAAGQVFLTSWGIAAVSFVLLLAVAASVLGFGLYLGSLAIADGDWRFGGAMMWSLATSAIGSAVGLLGVLVALVVT